MVESRERNKFGEKMHDVTTITGEQDLALLVEYVASKLPVVEYIKNAAAEALQKFSQIVYSMSGPSAIAFVDRRERYVRPILDIYILWSHPINLLSDAEELQQVSAEHAEALEGLHPALNSFLKIVDLRRYTSCEELNSALNSDSFCEGSTRVVACAQLAKAER